MLTKGIQCKRASFDKGRLCLGLNINLRAYPTGFNRLPSFYAWSGTLPYITNGTTTCVTANTDVSVLLSTSTYTQSLPSTQITVAVTDTLLSVEGLTLFPNVTSLPTHSVYDIDENDPKGWSYCYALGEGERLGSDFLSLFEDVMLSHIYENCSQASVIVSPAEAAGVATFLLD